MTKQHGLSIFCRHNARQRLRSGRRLRSSLPGNESRSAGCFAVRVSQANLAVQVGCCHGTAGGIKGMLVSCLCRQERMCFREPDPCFTHNGEVYMKFIFGLLFG